MEKKGYPKINQHTIETKNYICMHLYTNYLKSLDSMRKLKKILEKLLKKGSNPKNCFIEVKELYKSLDSTFFKEEKKLMAKFIRGKSYNKEVVNKFIDEINNNFLKEKKNLKNFEELYDKNEEYYNEYYNSLIEKEKFPYFTRSYTMNGNKEVVLNNTLFSPLVEVTSCFNKRSNIEIIPNKNKNLVVTKDTPQINRFPLNVFSKRTFCNKIDLIIDYNNRIFNEYPNRINLIINYTFIKNSIDRKLYTNGNFEEDYKEFLLQLYQKIFVDEFIEFIKDFVERNYSFKNENKDTKNFNADLLFTENHCKMLQSFSIAMKIAIPLITQFSYRYKIGKFKNINDYLEKSVDFLFPIFCPIQNSSTDKTVKIPRKFLELDITKGINERKKIQKRLYAKKGIDKPIYDGYGMTRKLYKAVESIVAPTKNSDKTFYKYIEIEGVTIDTIKWEIYKKIIVDIIIKYELDKNVVTLNNVTIKNNLNFMFRNNFDINYKSLDVTESEDEVSDMDKLSINTARIDEGLVVIQKEIVSDTINYLCKKFNIKVTKDEYDYYRSTIVRNKVQTTLMLNFYSSIFKDSNIFFYADRSQYIKLLIIMKHYLEDNSFEIIPSILSSNLSSYSEKISYNKKKLEKIRKSNEFTELVDDKYNFTKEIIYNEKSNPIENLFLLLTTNVFKRNDYQDDNHEEINFKDMIFLELYNFINLI